LQSRIHDIRSLDAEVLAISVDPPEDSREVVRALGLEFPVLSDTDGTVMDAFGVRHAGGGLSGDIARPALFILDRSGRVVWRDLTDNWRVRARPEPILERLARIP
jgi:peroxiredoxin